VYANLLSIAVPLPLPLSAILILVTDLGFELALALSFAWDVSESKTGLMKLPPRKPVTEHSVARIKQEQQTGKPGFFARLVQNWKDPIDEETLVDGEALSWGYLEAGTLETIGCLVCYFFAMWWGYGVTPADAVKYGDIWSSRAVPTVELQNGRSLDFQEREQCLAMGQSAFYIGIMFQQSFNLFANKARLGLPFGSFMIANPKTFYGLMIGTAFSFALVYIPPLNVAFGTNWQTTPIVWAIGFGFGAVLFVYSVLRFMIRRRWNPIKFSKDIQGLDLHPTRFSTGR
jgi:sodium/potassium-transporting ATPase subunit alpha